MPVPDHIDAAIIEQLPTGPGVYYFIDKNGAILYVGKSIHIKQRVLSHFYASGKDSKEKKLAFATHDIRFTKTAGELSALLLESREIKQHNPIFNRRLRRYRKLHSWQLSEDSERLSPTLVAAQWPPVPGRAALRPLPQSLSSEQRTERPGEYPPPVPKSAGAGKIVPRLFQLAVTALPGSVRRQRIANQPQPATATGAEPLTTRSCGPIPMLLPCANCLQPRCWYFTVTIFWATRPICRELRHYWLSLTRSCWT